MYYGVSDIEIAMDLDKRATCSKPPLKVSWWARTFGCALWHLRRYGFRSWLIWELQKRPRVKGPFDLVGKSEPKPVNPTQCYSLFPDLPNGGTRARVFSPGQINQLLRGKR